MLVVEGNPAPHLENSQPEPWTLWEEVQSRNSDRRSFPKFNTIAVAQKYHHNNTCAQLFHLYAGTSVYLCECLCVCVPVCEGKKSVCGAIRQVPSNLKKKKIFWDKLFHGPRSLNGGQWAREPWGSCLSPQHRHRVYYCELLLFVLKLLF